MFKILQWNCQGCRAKYEDYTLTCYTLNSLQLLYSGRLCWMRLSPVLPLDTACTLLFKLLSLVMALLPYFDVISPMLSWICGPIYRHLLSGHVFLDNTLYATCIFLPIKYLPCRTLPLSLTSYQSQWWSSGTLIVATHYGILKFPNLMHGHRCWNQSYCHLPCLLWILAMLLTSTCKPALALLLTSPCALPIPFRISAGSQWMTYLVVTTSLS